VTGSHRPEDATPDEGPTEVVPEVVPEGSGKQFAEDVGDVEELPQDPTAPDQGKGFAKGTPPEPTPDPAAPANPAVPPDPAAPREPPREG
jgi:hypothetical protein